MVDQLSVVRRRGHPGGPRGRRRGPAGRPGRTCPACPGTWRDLTDSVNFMAGNLTAQVRNIAEVTTAVARGDLTQKITVDARGRDPRAEDHRQHDGRPAVGVRRRGDPGRPRGRHRGPARRPGRRARRVRHLEGPHRERQHDGGQPDLAGPQHRRGDDRGRAGRPVPEDHRRRPRRDPRAEEHDEHDGRPAVGVRRRGDPRRPRGRHRGQARRPGARARASPAPGGT